jgi:transposase-like protein
MRCPACGSSAARERPERTTQGYRRFRCRCGKQFNERSSDVLNKTQYPSDVIALVVLWRLRYKLSLRDLAEMFLTRGFIFTYEAVREWEAKLTPALAENLRRKRKGRVGRRALRTELGGGVRHRMSCYLNNRLEQDHRGIKGRCRPMLGFKNTRSAKRYCRSYDELRSFLRCRSRMCQHVPAATRR